MRFAVRFSIALLLTLPLFASADGFVGLVLRTGVDSKSICPAGSAGSPSGVPRVFNASGAAALRSYMKQVIICPSACFDETIYMKIQGSPLPTITTAVRTTNQCKKTAADPLQQDAKKDKRGCDSGQEQPRLSIVITGYIEKTISGKSRCDALAVNALDSMLGNLNNGNITAAQADVGRLDALSKTADPMPYISNPQDPAQYGAVLKAFGMTDEKAIQDAIQNNPDAVKALADCAAKDESCTTETFTQAASDLKLNLNPNLKSIEEMKAEWQEKFDKEQSEAVTRRDPSAQETFEKKEIKDLDRAKCAIATIESGSCGGNYGTIGPPTRSGSRAVGKYQVMSFNIPSWTAQACGRVYNPEEFRADGNCQEKVFEKIYGGYVSSCGSYEGAASKWFSGRCNITNSNDGYLSVGGYVGKFAKIFSNDSLPFGAVGAPYRGGGSPFASANPFGPSYEDRVVCTGSGQCYLSNSSYPGPVSTGYPVSTGAPVSTGNPVSTGGTVSTQAPTTPVSQLLETGTGATTGAAPVAPGVATLLVQPQVVKRGSSVTVSWSSVGMRTDQLCQLFSGNTFMAQGNEGSRQFDTKSVATSTSVTFTLQCFSQAKVKIQKSVDVTIN